MQTRLLCLGSYPLLFVGTLAIGAMVADHAALLASAVRAACLAKAPRRTVQAVAAAVTAVLVRPTPVAPPDTDTGELAKSPDVNPDIREDELVMRLRMARAQRRRAKRQRRRDAKAAATSVPGDVVAQDTASTGQVGVPSEVPVVPAPVPVQDDVVDDGLAHTTSPPRKLPRLEGAEGDGLVGANPSTAQQMPVPLLGSSASQFRECSPGALSLTTVWTPRSNMSDGDRGSQPSAAISPRPASRGSKPVKVKDKRPGRGGDRGRGRRPR